MRILRCLIIIFCIGSSFLGSEAQSISSTYIGGTLSTKLNVYDNSCSGIMNLQLPANDFYIVTGVDVTYSFRSVAPFPVSQQRSFLEFVNTGVGEAEVSGPLFGFQNPVLYSRTGLDIANGSFPGGTNLEFALRIKSENLMDLSVTGCDNLRHYVEDASWTVTVHYTQGPKVGINTDSPEALLDVNGKIMISDDDYSAKEGMIKYDEIGKEFAGYDGNAWQSLSRSDLLQDEDGDTKVLMEDLPGADNDEIGLFLGGLKRWEFLPNRIEPLANGGNLLIGLASGGLINGTDNSVFGDLALSKNAGGVSNVAVGFQSMLENTTGYENTAVGKRSLWNNTDGFHNTAIGHEAMESNTEGNLNIAIGKDALSGNITGSNNISIGARSGQNLQTDNENVIIGYESFSNNNSSGNGMTIIGAEALSNSFIFSADSAVVVGHSANASSGQVAIGTGSLASFGVAIGKRSHAFQNSIAIGEGAKSEDASILIGTNSSLNRTFEGRRQAIAIGHDINAGTRSVAIGHNASSLSWGLSVGRSSTSGERSVSLGNVAFSGRAAVAVGEGSRSGGSSIAVGHDATAENNSVAVGEEAESLTSGVAIGQSTIANQNAIALGNDVTAPANSVVIGSSTVTSIGGPQAWTNLSDARYKKAVKRDVPGIDFIGRLQPVTYEIDIRKLSTENITQSDLAEAGNIRHTGFLAQDVEKAALSLGYDFYGVDRPKERGGKYGLRYAIFVVPLVKAVQEQQELIDIQNEKIKTLESEIERIQSEDDLVSELLTRIEMLEKSFTVKEE